jgi:hypothetical protein
VWSTKKFLPSAPNQTDTVSKYYEKDTFGFALITICSSIIVPFTLGPCGSYFGIDVLYPLAQLLIARVPISTYFTVFVRYFIAAYFSYRTWQTLVSLLVLLAIFLQSALKLVCILTETLNILRNIKPCNLPVQRLKSVIRLHTELSLICSAIGEVLSFLPFLLLLGVFLIVIGDYGTLKMYSIIEMPWFLGFPGLSLIVKIIIAVLLPQATKIYETADQFRLGLYYITRTKHDKRIARSFRPARINFGSLFFAKKSTKSAYFKTIFDATINSLLLF